MKNKGKLKELGLIGLIFSYKYGRAVDRSEDSWMGVFTDRCYHFSRWNHKTLRINTNIVHKEGGNDTATRQVSLLLSWQ